jgi:hypothetical protein
MLNMADRTGLTVTQIDKLQAQAKIAGVSIESLENIGRVLGATLTDVGGGSSKAQVALDKLNISSVNAKGEQRELGQVAFELIEKLAGVKNQAEQVALANATLGRGSKEILPLLRSYEDTKRAVEALGFGMEEHVIRKLAGSADEVDKLVLRWELLKRQLAVPLTAVVDVVSRIAGAAGQVSTQGLAGAAFGGMAGALGFHPRPRIPEGLLPGFGAEAQAAATVQQRAAAERARQQFSRSEEGRRQRLQEVGREISEAQAKLFSAALETPARQVIERQLATAQAEKRQIEAGIKATEEARRKAEEWRRKIEEMGTFILKEDAEYNRRNAPVQGQPSLFRPGERIRNPALDLPGTITGGAFQINAGAQAAAMGPLLQSQAQQAQARIAGIAQAEERARQRRIQSLEIETDLQIRKIELMTGPGGEVAAINQITALRLASLEQQKRLGGDVFQIQQEQYRVQEERELRILELRKQQRESVRRAGESLFDAALAGGGGLKQFALSQLLVPGRQIAGNLAVELFGGSAGKLQLPGLTNAAGQANLFGRLLQGTPFGIDPLKNATELNTQATIQNTAAILGSATIARGGTIPGIGGAVGGLGGIFSGAGGTNPLIFHGLPGGGGDVLSSISNQSRATRDLATLFGIQTRTGPGGLARGVGIAGLLGGAAFGAYSGFSAGGAQGALMGSSSILGGAAGLLPLLGVSGPLAPILGAGALGAGLIAALIGDPKQRETKRIDQMLESARYSETMGRNYLTDIRGGLVDYNAGGQIRVYNTNVQMSVQTLDSRSFRDNIPMVIDEMSNGLKNGQGGDLMDTIRQGL